MSIEKILIIDDEILIRNFLAETLKRKNFEVTTAESGTAALPLIKNNTYDLVITDMKMPGITGIEVLKKVKEASPQTLVIIITAFGSIENAVEAMRLGAFNYLIKPFSPEEGGGQLGSHSDDSRDPLGKSFPLSPLSYFC